MSSSGEHKSKARHNECFHDKIRSNYPNSFIDWQITSLFYSTIHLIDSYAVKNNIKDYGDHNGRTDFVKNNCRTIWSQYNTLRDICWIVRYKDCTNCISKKSYLENELTQYFQEIKNYFTTLI